MIQKIFLTYSEIPCKWNLMTSTLLLVFLVFKQLADQ